jgi:hypothetical protein
MVSIRLPGASAPVRPLATIVRGAGRGGEAPREYRSVPRCDSGWSRLVVDAAATSGDARYVVAIALLALTGICVGCRLYFLRWWVPSLFARAFRRADRLAPLEVPAINRIG